ncbi:hypothetical protein P7C70_g3657, partial [Phenoliferia sp. Uapishka_3]
MSQASTSSLPPPLPLPRIQRLLRPLRTTLAALLPLLSSPASNPTSRLSTIPPRRDSTWKGKSRATDTDYRNNQGVARLRRPPPPQSSSPFQVGRRRHRTKKKYGAAKIGATAKTSANGNGREPTPPRAKRKDCPPLDLVASGFDSETIVKIGHLVKAYRNVLECCYSPRSRRTSGEGEGGERSAGSGVVSLVESSARRVGWELEVAVKFLEEEEDEAHLESRGYKMDEQSETMRLVEEWYEAVPPYARSWMLGHHATSIIIEGLDNVGSFTVLLALLEVCRSFSAATYEASLFASSLISLSLSPPFSQPPPSIPLLSLSTLFPLRTAFFSSLSTTLLSSTFSDRLFYSDYLDLTRTSLFREDGERIARLLEVLCGVGGEMVEGILALGDEEGEGDDEEGIDEMVEEVVYRLAAQLERALPILLLHRPITLTPIATATPIHSKAPAEPVPLAAWTDLANSLQSFIAFAPSSALEELLPLLLPLELFLVSKTSDTIMTLERIDELLALAESLHLRPIMPTSYFSILIENIETTEMVELAVILNSYEGSERLKKLERLLLAEVVESYDELADVRKLKNAADYSEVIEKSTFEDLLAARGGVSDSTTSEVVVERRPTPSPLRPTKPKPTLDEQHLPHTTPGKLQISPLSYSPLGRPFRLARCNAISNNVMGPPSTIARRAKRPIVYTEPADDSDTNSGDEEILGESGDEGEVTVMEDEGDGFDGAEDGNLESGEDSGEDWEDTDLGNLEDTDDEAESDTATPLARSTETIDLSHDTTSDDNSGSEFEAPFPLIRHPIASPRKLHFPSTSESDFDEMDLLASARPRKRSRVSPVKVKERRQKMAMARRKMESSEDELAM